MDVGVGCAESRGFQRGPDWRRYNALTPYPTLTSGLSVIALDQPTCPLQNAGGRPMGNHNPSVLAGDWSGR